MLTQIIWWVSILLMSTLLVRALQGRYASRYLLFYLYLAWVLVSSLICFYTFSARPASYATVYWHTQFLSLALGYGVIWVVYSQVLADCPGVLRAAQTVLLVVLVGIVGKTVAVIVNGEVSSPSALPALLERDLRAAQAILLLVIVALVAYYRIPIGKNLRGIIVGYGVFICASVVSLTLRAYLGKPFQSWWQYLQPSAYDLTLLIWCAALWSYEANPKPQSRLELEFDYEAFAAQVSRALARARTYLFRTARS